MLIARGGAGSFAVKIIGAGAVLGADVSLARMLGAREYGIYSYVWTWIYVIAVFSHGGFRESLVRIVSNLTVRGACGELKGVLGFSTSFVLLLNFTLSVLVICLLDGQDLLSHERLENAFAVGFLALPFVAGTFLREGALRGVKWAVRSELPFRVFRPTMLFGLCGFLWLLRGELHAVEALSIAVLVAIGMYLLATFWMVKAISDSIATQDAIYDIHKWIRISLPFLVISGMALVNAKTDIVMLGAMKGTFDAGIYNAASQVSSLIAFPLMATNTIVAPLIAELYGEGRQKDLQSVITWSSAAVGAVVLVIFLVLMVLGGFLLNLYGDVFVVAYVPLIILATGQLFNALAGPVGYVLSMTAFAELTAAAFTVGAFVNLLLNLVLIPQLGMEGAAIASASSMALWNCLLGVHVWRKLRIDPTAFTALRRLFSRQR